MRRETRLAHYGRPKAPGPANPPVVRASTVLHDSLESYEDTLARRAVDETVLSYGRRGTTTAHALMEAITDLEGGEGTVVHPFQLLHPIPGGEGDDISSKSQHELVQFIGGMDVHGVTGPARTGRFQVQPALGGVQWLTVEVMGQQRCRSPPEFHNTPRA